MIQFGKSVVAALVAGVPLMVPAYAQTTEVPAFVAHKGIGFSTQDEKTGVVTAYDVVAALDDRQMVIADCSKNHAVLKGVIWCFADTENMETFRKATKERKFNATGVVQELNEYLPAFGGWCAWGQSNTNWAKGDPRTFFVYEGRLIVNGSHDVADRYKKDPALRTALANLNYRLSMAGREVIVVPNKQQGN